MNQNLIQQTSRFIYLDGIWAFSALIVISIIAALTILIITLIVTNRFRNFSFGKFSFNKERRKEKSLPVNNIGNIILKIVRIQTHISEERDAIIREQMNYLEMKLNYIREYDLRCYLNLLADKLNNITEDKLLKSDHYQNYINMIYRVYKEVLYTFKIFLKENHIERYQNNSWSNYKNERISFLISKMNRELDISFQPSFSPVTRRELSDRMQTDLSSYITECFDDIFDNSKRIISEKNNNIMRLKKEVDEYIEKICGEKINV